MGGEERRNVQLKRCTSWWGELCEKRIKEDRFNFTVQCTYSTKYVVIEDSLDRSKMSQGLAGVQITGLQTSLRSGSSRHVDLFQGIARA